MILKKLRSNKLILCSMPILYTYFIFESYFYLIILFTINYMHLVTHKIEVHVITDSEKPLRQCRVFQYRFHCVHVVSSMRQAGIMPITFVIDLFTNLLMFRPQYNICYIHMYVHCIFSQGIFRCTPSTCLSKYMYVALSTT